MKPIDVDALAAKCTECKHYVGRSDAGLCTANGALKKVPFYISKYHALCQGYNYIPKQEKENENGTDSERSTE